jgi:exosortase A-associated hydrolase 2
VGVTGTFIDGGAGRILLVSHEPQLPPMRAVVVVPAFGEEMNKSRRLINETAIALRERGMWTIIPDLFGTGDSEGDLEDARWSIWMDDLRRTFDWARGKGAKDFDLLLVRIGASLFAEAEKELQITFGRAVAWHAANGVETLKHLLRMKSMAIRMAGGRAPSMEASLESLLKGPGPTELGGYLLAPELAQAMNRASFSPSRTATVTTGLLLEMDSATDAETGMPNVEQADAAVWRRKKIAAERFWLATEPGPNPALVEATVSFLAEE